MHDDVGVGQHVGDPDAGGQIESGAPAGRNHLGAARSQFGNQFRAQSAVASGHHHGHHPNL
jgi:hypothetical protein